MQLIFLWYTNCNKMLDDYRREIKDYNGFYQRKTREDRIKYILKYATLAPSTHNTQPWQFKIKGDSCELYINSKKKLPQADPTGRDLYISMGCCLENLITAAKYFRVYKSYKLYGEEDNKLAAKVYFKDLNKKTKFDKKYNKLMHAIVHRINVRGLFSRKSIAPENLTEINNLNENESIQVLLVSNKKKIERLADLTAQGLQLAHANPKFRNEMSKWVNSSLVNRKEGIPTYSLRVPLLLSMFFPLLIKNFNMGNKLSKLNYLSMKSAPLVCVFTANKDSKEIWLETGRLAERVMLELNSNKIRTSPFIASIDLGDLYKQAQKVLKTDSKPQFMFCAGYMKVRQGITPRISTEGKII